MRRSLLDAALAWGLIVLSALESIATPGRFAPDSLACAAIVAGAVALRHWRAEAAVAVVLAGFAVTAATGADQLVGLLLGTMIVLYSAGSELERTRAAVAAALVIGSIEVALLLEPDYIVWDSVFPLFFFGGPWLAGRLVRRARRAEEVQRREAAQDALRDERAAIARELHDVVAHGVSAMVVQAGALRHLLGSPSPAEEHLRTIEATGRQSLDELRRLLGVLREAGGGDAALAPQPRLDALDELAAPLRVAGSQVDVRVQGEVASLPAGVQVAAYRIVQEALTNCLKHARPRRVSVDVARVDGVLRLSVRDDGGTIAAADGAPGAGHGLVGMRERAALYGGRVEAGPDGGAGYEVRAELPVRD